MSLFSIATAADSYKATHWNQYPPGTEYVYSYFESRAHPFEWSGDTVFFGLQYLLKKYFKGCIVTEYEVDRATDLWAKHFGKDNLFNREGWMHIVDKYDGRLPVSIKAVPEGTPVSTRNVLMTIENTDPKCFWLTNWLETILVQTWYPTTIATQSRESKKILHRFLERTGDVAGLPFKLHDFGYRGVTCPEQAALGGAAHLVSFQGTDTFAGVEMLCDYYGADMPGFSIPASEHSTITAWGEANEVDAFRNMLEQYPTGLVACVSDSYDIMRACKDYWGKELRDKILSRNGTLVVRPDSGDPTTIVLGVLDALGEAFGTTKNDKGYKVLPPQVRVIQGDGIDIKTMEAVLTEMASWKWSADNIAFGSGGGLLQKVNRDTLAFAFKCSEITVNGEHRDVYKNPATDESKRSKRGRLALVWGTPKDGVERPPPGLTLCTIPADRTEPGDDLLVEVFRDGKILKDYTLDEVRARAAL